MSEQPESSDPIADFIYRDILDFPQLQSNRLTRQMSYELADYLRDQFREILNYEGLVSNIGLEELIKGVSPFPAYVDPDASVYRIPLRQDIDSSLLIDKLFPLLADYALQLGISPKNILPLLIVSNQVADEAKEFYNVPFLNSVTFDQIYEIGHKYRDRNEHISHDRDRTRASSPSISRLSSPRFG